MNMLAASVNIGGDGFVNQLLTLLIVGIAAGVLYAMGYWFCTRPKVAAAAPVALTIWNGLFVLIGGIIIINFLLGLAGRPFIKW